MSRPKKPELKLTGNVAENFKNFEMRFNDYCIESEYRDLSKDPDTEKTTYYKKPIIEISALRSAMPDEALQVIRYTIEPQIPDADKKKPWVWMDKLRVHYAGSAATSLLTDRFKYWTTNQSPHESVQDWETRVRQTGSLCNYGALTDQMCRDKFIFGLHDSDIRTELLKCHLKPDKTEKALSDVVREARALESARQTNKLIGDANKSIEENVNWVTKKAHRDMKLKREPGTCQWCGDRRGPHPWKDCPANGRTCMRCSGNDHFARVCLEAPNQQSQTYQPSRGRGRGRGGPQANQRGRGTYRRDQPRYQQRGPSASTPVNALQSDELQEFYTDDGVPEDDYQYDCYAIEPSTSSKTARRGKKYFAHLALSKDGHSYKDVRIQIDSAASMNTIPEKLIKGAFPAIEMKRSPYLLSPYMNTKPFRPLGQVELVCERGGKFHSLLFQVIADKDIGDKPALISGEDSEALGLLRIEADEILCVSTELGDAEDRETPTFRIVKRINKQEDNSALPKGEGLEQGASRPATVPARKKLGAPGQLTKENILEQYKDSFEGLGNLGPPVHFELRQDIAPVQMPVHRVPVAKREKEKAALDRYVELGIMSKVDEPTPWCSNALIRETPKKVRVCIDPSQTINKAILRPVFQIPTLNEHLHKLCNAKCFSLVDVREGFLHIPLDEESSFLTTMHTSYGRYRWLCLPFGVSSAPEEFQKRLLDALEGLEGIICIADDILVYGEGDTKEDALKDHDRRLVALMERCVSKNIKLNAEKFKFKLREVKFMGNVITDNGMRPDPDKVSAITQMPTPTDKAGLLRFIGMANYLSPYCKNLSAEIQPLRMLTKEGMAFLWSETQEEAFRKAKSLIASAPTLMYYDLHKPVILQVDASEKGLGGALLQLNDEGFPQPVAFTSCSMNQTEQRYSQIEKECLAICQGFHKFDQWLYGKSDITVHTDHKPLETILKKPLNKAPARLQKMIMTLQRYSFKLEYRKGTSLLIADTLSRAALTSSVRTKVTGFNVFRADFEVVERDPKLTLHSESEIILETASDPTLSGLYRIISEGWPECRDNIPLALRPYWGYRDELSINNGAIYKGLAVLVPPSMVKHMLEKIHANHLGGESNYRMARDVLFWPGMRKAIKDMCESCDTCARYGTAAPKEPMQSLPIPTRAWDIVSQDLFSFEKEDYLVTVCHFSDWIEVDKLPDTLSTTVVERTKGHFSRYGIPSIVHTDNGPQFISREYKDLSSNCNFRHTTSSPYYAKGNGRAEAAVKVAKAMLKKSEDFQLALLLYRNTPPAGHTYSPAQRMLCRRTRSTLPTSDNLLNPQPIDPKVVQEDISAKRRASRAQYDKSAGLEHKSLSVGDYAYLKPPPNRRGQPWTYGQISKMEGPRSYTIVTPHGQMRRNRVHVRPAAPPPHNYNPRLNAPPRASKFPFG